MKWKLAFTLIHSSSDSLVSTSSMRFLPSLISELVKYQSARLLTFHNSITLLDMKNSCEILQFIQSPRNEFG
jgi:hypothetical protein